MSAKFPGPAYRIVTPRLVIRCWDPKDAPLFKATIDQNVEHLKTFIPWAVQYPQDIQQQVEMMRSFRGKFDLGQDFLYGIFNQDETRVLGGTGLHTRLGDKAREIGYWIDKASTGLGIATEVSAVLTQVAFDIESMQRVEIHCAVENLASAAIPRKLGFTHDATLRQRSQLLDGQFHDMMVWSILQGEFSEALRQQYPYTAYDALERQLLE